MDFPRSLYDQFALRNEKDTSLYIHLQVNRDERD